MTAFDRDTALRPAGPAGVYEGAIDPSWRIIRGANGGHVAAILLRGCTLAVDDAERTPRSLNVHFLRVPKEEPFRLETTVERAGRTMSTVTARIVQDDKPVAIALAAFALEREAPAFAELLPPEVPSPEDAEPIPDRDDFAFGRHFDIRRALGASAPDPGGPAETAVWIRLREPRVADHLVATQLLDAWAPAVFAKLGQGGGGGGVPTIDMTWHYRSVLPAPGASADDWYLGVFRSHTARGGFVEEDGWLWDRKGTLLAQSRQLAMLTG